ncbi:UNVERIFIED_CONTAM: hypothetical protein Sradi_6986800, partial [Sesamum radiatum]
METKEQSRGAQDEDQNTKYYHSQATVRNRKNEIRKIKNTNGVMVHEKDDIQNVILAYFRDLLTTIRPEYQNLDDVLQHVDSKVRRSMTIDLCQPYTTVEVTKALKLNVPQTIARTRWYAYSFLSKIL